MQNYRLSKCCQKPIVYDWTKNKIDDRYFLIKLCSECKNFIGIEGFLLTYEKEIDKRN